MSKQQEINEQCETDLIRNRILVIVMVALGVLLVVRVLVIPMINIIGNQAGKTSMVIAVTPITNRLINAMVDGLRPGDSTAPVKIDI